MGHNMLSAPIAGIRWRTFVGVGQHGAKYHGTLHYRHVLCCAVSTYILFFVLIFNSSTVFKQATANRTVGRNNGGRDSVPRGPTTYAYSRCTTLDSCKICSTQQVRTTGSHIHFHKFRWGSVQWVLYMWLTCWVLINVLCAHEYNILNTFIIKCVDTCIL